MSDLVGQKYGRLTVTARAPNSPRGKKRWWCKCDCGNTKDKPVLSYDLTSGRVRSCGCLYFESNKGINVKHGLSNTRLFNIWSSMKQRCYNPKAVGYKNYGARGIVVCDLWRDDFSSFRSWALSHGYSEGLTIDRINNDGGYSPDNCRWIPMKLQQNHRRNNHRVVYCGETYTIAQLALKFNISAATLAWRIAHNWDQNDWGRTPAYNNKYTRR